MLTKSDLGEIRKLIKSENKSLENRIISLDGNMNKGFKMLNKKLDATTDFLDRDYLRLLKRIERIEKHLQLKPLS